MAKYNKHTVEAICSFIRDGDSQRLACRKAGIGDSTFHDWIKAKPEFSDNIKKAKEDFQATIVGKLEATLWKRAMGYQVTETEAEYVPDDKGNPKIKIQKTKVKHIQPDTGALIFALTNVSPNKWTNRQRLEMQEPKDIVDNRQKYRFEDLPEEMLINMANKLQENEYKRRQEEHNGKETDSTTE